MFVTYTANEEDGGYCRLAFVNKMKLIIETQAVTGHHSLF
jgi:hypothetical protein